MDFYKIGSGDLTAFPVLRATAQRKKPILISTGLSDEKEVLDVVHFIQGCDPMYLDPGNLAILQCTAMYPIRYQDAHLNVMGRLRSLTGLPIGYSDHTEGTYALEIAVALGAQILEFHFTDKREGKEFRDHKVSLIRDEVQTLISKINSIEQLKGHDIKRPLEIEGDHTVSFRRAVYPKENLSKGDQLNDKNLICLRPNHGIDAREYDQLLGKKLKTDVREHQKLTWDMLED